MKRIFNHAAVSMLFAAYAVCAQAANDGVVTAHTGASSIERSGESQPLQLGSRIVAGDRVRTEGDGYVGITMRDQTHITLGPYSDLRLDTFSFNPQTDDNRFGASFMKGRMRVVTGLIGRRSPQSFSVHTTNSTIGIRGTSFIVEAR